MSVHIFYASAVYRNVVISIVLSSLIAPEVVKMTISMAISDKKFLKMTAQCINDTN